MEPVDSVAPRPGSFSHAAPQVAILDIDPATPQIAAGMPLARCRLRRRRRRARPRGARPRRGGRRAIRTGGLAIADAGICPAGPRCGPCRRSRSNLCRRQHHRRRQHRTRQRSIRSSLNQGQIVLISSVFAFLNGMGAIPYAMSKAAVEAARPWPACGTRRAPWRLNDHCVLLPDRDGHGSTHGVDRRSSHQKK